MLLGPRSSLLWAGQRDNYFGEAGSSLSNKSEQNVSGDMPNHVVNQLVTTFIAIKTV